MKLFPDKIGFPWTIPAALLSILAITVLAQPPSPPTYNFAKDVHVRFEKEEYVVCKTEFMRAVNQYSKPYVGPCATEKTKAHDVCYDSDKAEDGVSTDPPSPCSGARTGSHVTQYVSFKGMEELEKFVEATKGPQPSPCPPDPQGRK